MMTLERLLKYYSRKPGIKAPPIFASAAEEITNNIIIHKVKIKLKKTLLFMLKLPPLIFILHK